VSTLTVVVIAGLIAGCSLDGPPAGSGDPGNARLHIITADGTVNTLPPTARLYRPLIVTPAAWDSADHYWTQPEAISEFSSALTINAVYTYYATLAGADGWTPAGSNPLGLVYYWTKSYHAGFTAALYLAGPGPGVYRSSHVTSTGLYNLTVTAPVIMKS
jgi:hypothetical protein